MLRRAADVRIERKPGRAKGTGEFECRYLVEEGENEQGVQFVHDDTLDPGAPSAPTATSTPRRST